MFPLHLEPIDYFRTTKFAVPLDELPILPASRSPQARVRAKVARAAKKARASALRAQGNTPPPQFFGLANHECCLTA
jgi:hypothetical protein